MKTDLYSLLKESASDHSHLCPRQVLGVRMGLAGLTSIGVKVPVTDHTALVIIETGGCFADGIRVATGATVGHRTLRVEDLGKIAATFTNLITDTSVRLAPQHNVRTKALEYAADEQRHYFAQLKGYQVMPGEELFTFQRVKLLIPASQIISRQNARAKCSACGEEIINEREVVVDNVVMCQTCGNGSYYLVK
ncbi:MAG TPA: FmdE family protein [Anaerolineales bacterium]|nr:FmdE family protein [Anaerolineales bacterium]